jgi:hypothetical protein
MQHILGTAITAVALAMSTPLAAQFAQSQPDASKLVASQPETSMRVTSQPDASNTSCYECITPAATRPLVTECSYECIDIEPGKVAKRE